MNKKCERKPGLGEVGDCSLWMLWMRKVVVARVRRVLHRMLHGMLHGMQHGLNAGYALLLQGVSAGIGRIVSVGYNGHIHVMIL